MRLIGIGPSERAGKKLVATFDDGRRVHFGAAGYGDYTLYWRQSPAVARVKRAHYIARHARQERWRDPATPATLARYVLWERPTLAGAVAAYRRRFRV